MKNFIVYMVFVMISLGLVGLGVYLYMQKEASFADWQAVEGEVVDHQMYDSRVRSNETMGYHLVIAFTDGSGREYRVVSRTATYPAARAIGEKVTLYYPPNDPSQAVMAGFFDNHFLSFVLWILGGLGVLFGGFAAWCHRP